MKEFKSRLQYLKTNSTSKECKDICSTFEGFIGKGVSLSEENLTSLLIEKLEKIEVKDSIVSEFISKEKKMMSVRESDNLGVLKTIENIKKSKISGDPTLKYVLESFEKEIQKGTPEYLLIDGYISRVSPYKFDSIVKESVDTLSATKTKLALELLIKESIFYIKANDNNNFFTEVIEKLNKFLAEGNKNIAGLAQELKRWSFNPTVNSLVGKLSLMENESSFNVPVVNGNCDVTKIYSPVLFNHNGGDVFVAEGIVFKNTKTGVTRLSAEEIKALPAKFVTLCESFLYPGIKMEGENIIFYKGKNKITLGVNESGNTLTLNGKNYDIKNIGNHLYYSGAFNNGDLKEIEVLTTIAEGLDSIFDIDWGKTISSRVYEGAKAIVFRHGDKIFINKINPSMHENVLIKTNGTQASNLIKSFLKYDISESLSDLLVGEKAKISSLERERKVILESINKLEAELTKIEDAIVVNPKIEESREIVDMKEFLSAEINALKSRWSLVESKIKNLSSIIEEGTFSAGDRVKVIADGKTGSVESVNDNSNKVNVIMEDGRTLEFIPEALQKSEDEIEENMEDNEEEGDDFKGVKEDEEEEENEVGDEESTEEEPAGEEMGDEESEEEPAGEEEMEEPTGEEGEEEIGDEPMEEPTGEEGEEEIGDETGDEVEVEIPAEGPEGEEQGLEPVGPISGPDSGSGEVSVGAEEPISAEEPIAPEAPIAGEAPIAAAVEEPIDAPAAEVPTAVGEPTPVVAPKNILNPDETSGDSAADPKMADVLTDPLHPTQGEQGEEVIYTYNDEEEPVDPLAVQAPVADVAPVASPIESSAPVEEADDEEENAGPEADPEVTGDDAGDSSAPISFDDDGESSGEEELGSDEEGLGSDEEGIEEEPVTLDSVNAKLDALLAKIETIPGVEGDEEEGAEGEELTDEPSEEEESDDDTFNAEGGEESTEEIPAEEEEPTAEESAEVISERQKHYTPKGKESKVSKVKQEIADKKKKKAEKEKEKEKADKVKEKAKASKKDEKKKPAAKK